MKKIWKYMVVILTVVCAASCNNSEIDDLRRDVDNLYSRLEAIQKQVDALNNNVEALNVLLNGATVNSVTESDGTYTVTLSNGDVLTLTQGSEGGYYTPVVAVDAEGYWTVSADGITFTRVLDKNNNPVKAVAAAGSDGGKGNDGLTPVFKVDESGYWMVGYDGVTFNRVTDVSGNPVKADEGVSQDKFFAGVTVDGDLLTIELLTGETISVPIIAGFKCMIANTEDVVYFALNESKTFDVDMAGVISTVVAAPQGWTAVLAEKQNPPAGTPGYTLTVSAPASEPAPAGRATADSRIDVSILAVSGSGLSTVSKVRVALNSMVLHTPVVTGIAVEQTTETSLTFTATLNDATGFRYVCLPESDPAPDAATVFASGTEGNVGASTTVSGLVHTTQYTIYAVAYHGSTVGTAVAAQSARTARGVIDYWENGVTINGVTYDKNTAGATLITSTASPIAANGVYFLDLPAGEAVTLNKLTVTNLVLIGRHSNLRGKIVTNNSATTNYYSLGTGNGLILKNVELDGSGLGNYLFNFAGGTNVCQNFIIEDSKLITPAGKHITFFSNANTSITKVLVNNSIIKVVATGNGSAVRFLNYGDNSGNITEGGSVTIRNNVFYTDGFVTHGTLIHINLAANPMPDVSVDVSNNSLINFIGYPNGYFNISTVKSVNFRKNILWGISYTNVSYVFKFLVADPGATLDYTDNKVYGLVESNAGCWKFFQDGSSYKPSTGNYTKEASNPFSEMNFATDTFEPVDPAYGYVAQ